MASIAAVAAVAYFAVRGGDNDVAAATGENSSIDASSDISDRDRNLGVGNESERGPDDGGQGRLPGSDADDQTDDNSSNSNSNDGVGSGRESPDATAATTEAEASDTTEAGDTTDAPIDPGATTNPSPPTPTSGGPVANTPTTSSASTPTSTERPTTTTTEPTATTRATTRPTARPTTTAAEPTTTTTTPTTTTTTRPTTTTTAAPVATPIQIVTQPFVLSTTSNSFRFNYVTNDVCGSGSFTVYDNSSGEVMGSHTGDGICYGPRHGGFPQPSDPTFGGYDLQPATTYRVVVSVRGVADNGGPLPAGSGSDSASLLVTTSP